MTYSLLLAAAALIAPARAPEPPPARAAVHISPAWRPATWRPAAAPAAAGMRVAIDPETGAPGMPSATEMAALAPADEPLDRDLSDLVEQVAPSGARFVNLNGRLMDYAVLRIGADGRPHFACVQDLRQAARAMRAPIAEPAAPEVK